MVVTHFIPYFGTIKKIQTTIPVHYKVGYSDLVGGTSIGQSNLGLGINVIPSISIFRGHFKIFKDMKEHF